MTPTAIHALNSCAAALPVTWLHTGSDRGFCAMSGTSCAWSWPSRTLPSYWISCVASRCCTARRTRQVMRALFALLLRDVAWVVSACPGTGG